VAECASTLPSAATHAPHRSLRACASFHNQSPHPIPAWALLRAIVAKCKHHAMPSTKQHIKRPVRLWRFSRSTRAEAARSTARHGPVPHLHRPAHQLLLHPHPRSLLPPALPHRPRAAAPPPPPCPPPLAAPEPWAALLLSQWIPGRDAQAPAAAQRVAAPLPAPPAPRAVSPGWHTPPPAPEQSPAPAPSGNPAQPSNQEHMAACLGPAACTAQALAAALTTAHSR
jgi:hypothetical protein